MNKYVALLLTMVALCWSNVFALSVDVRLSGIEHGFIDYTDEQGKSHRVMINVSSKESLFASLNVQVGSLLKVKKIGVSIKDFSHKVISTDGCLRVSHEGITSQLAC